MERNKKNDLDNANSIRKNGIARIPTGIPSLDDMLGGGLRRGSLTLIASRPGMGKTSLVLQIAGNIAAAGKSVYFCSLELSEDGFNRFFLKQNGAIPARKTLYFDDQAHADVPYIAEKIRSLAKCDVVFIDYLELMARRTTPKALTEIISALKELALSESIPVILTCQIGRRAPLTDFDKIEAFRPELSDLLRSGALTQDPDVIIFPFRESYYFKDAETTGKDELIVAKNRYGTTGTIPVHWDPVKIVCEELSQ